VTTLVAVSFALGMLVLLAVVALSAAHAELERERKEP
jgi:Flp pilus assembly protein TadG